MKKKTSSQTQQRRSNRPQHGNAALKPALIRQLGKRPDTVLAAEHDVPVNLVRKERRRRGINACLGRKWSKKEISLLGRMSDREVAERIGISANSVFQKRTSLGIDPFKQSSESCAFRWTRTALRKLGQVPDQTLAESLGVSVDVVASRRRSAGIAPYSPQYRPRRPWTKKELRLLGKRSDNAVSEQTGRGRRHVRAKRESLGIPPFQQQTGVVWTRKLEKHLGTVSDRELAHELGVAVATVGLHRRRLGIPAFRTRTS